MLFQIHLFPLVVLAVQSAGKLSRKVLARRLTLSSSASVSTKETYHENPGARETGDRL